MKIMMAVFACSFAAALAVGATTPAGGEQLLGPPLDPCPGIPTIYACCDGTSQGTTTFCADHGGTCGVLKKCNINF